MDFDVVPYEDIAWGERIGGGSFGSVFKGQYLGIDIAIKEIHMSNQYDVHKYFEREWRIMRECRHPNIVLFLGLSKETGGDGRVFIVSEYIPRGNLRTFIRSHAPFPWRLRISYATDVARAVAYLHARQCIHRDLKGENLLITSNDRLKVADFGFARITGRNAEEMKHMTYCGTDGYMSPEIIMGEQFDLPTDVYSLGIIFIEILTGILVGSKVYSRGAPAFTPDPDIVRRRAAKGCPPAFIDLALECCAFHPSERPKMPEVLERLREIERGLPEVDETPVHVGSVRVPRREGKRAMPIFDMSLASELAAAEVEAEVGGMEDMSHFKQASEDEERKAIARAEVDVDGAGPAKSIPWDEMTSDFIPPTELGLGSEHVGGEDPLLGSSSGLASWRTADPTETTLPYPPVHLIWDHDTVAGSPARPMPCDYPPSPPYDSDEADAIGSTRTIRGERSSRVLTPEMDVVDIPKEEPMSPTKETVMAKAIGLPTPQPSEDGSTPKASPTTSAKASPEISPKVSPEPSRKTSPKASAKAQPKTGKAASRTSSECTSTHRFSIVHREQPALFTVANLAFAFLPRPSTKEKCLVCQKRMGGSRVALQCDDCGILVHTKCSTAAPLNCHAAAGTATRTCSLGVDP